MNTRQGIAVTIAVWSLFGDCLESRAAPNLTPYKPDGWSDKIVVARATGTTTDAADLTPNDTLYVDWAVINSGDATINVAFHIELYVDGVLKNTWRADPPTTRN